VQFHVTYDRPEIEARSGPVHVGWLLKHNDSGVIFAPPERVRSVEMNRRHAKSASRCPAVINLESRYFVIQCPFDLHLGLAQDDEGGPLRLVNRAGGASPVRPKTLSKHLYLVDKTEWRYPDRPTIQLVLPYVFIADEPVYISQIAPFMHYRSEQLPGTIFGGRFPISLWPRPLMWAFEWREPEKDLVLKRGEPLFYVQFETEPADRGVQVIEAEKTPELLEYLELVSGATNYVSQTFSLFEAAEARRPARLLRPKWRK